ncbi:MAG: MarR family winged helix-turn-helix transcriptional regulator [Chloroflexota bacterium]
MTLSAAPASPRPALSASDPRIETWRSFIHAHARLMRRLDEELQAAHGLSLAEYDALLQLVNAPGRRLRMSALADRVVLSRSGITRLVDRLVASGMVERSACTTDARGAEAALTSVGLDRLRAASRTHLDGVQRYFLGVIDPADLESMQRSLDRIGGGLDGLTDPIDTACAISGPA